MRSDYRRKYQYMETAHRATRKSGQYRFCGVGRRRNGVARPFANCPVASDAVRALAWFGPREVEDALAAVASQLSDDDMAELAAARAIMPAWMAEPVSALVADG